MSLALPLSLSLSLSQSTTVSIVHSEHTVSRGTSEEKSWFFFLNPKEEEKNSEILPLLLVLRLLFFQYGFWIYRKAGHMEATLVEFYIDDTSSFHVSLKLNFTPRSKHPLPHQS